MTHTAARLVNKWAAAACRPTNIFNFSFIFVVIFVFNFVNRVFRMRTLDYMRCRLKNFQGILEIIITTRFEILKKNSVF